MKSEHVQSNLPIHTGTPDTTQTGPSCSVWCGGVNWALGLGSVVEAADSEDALIVPSNIGIVARLLYVAGKYLTNIVYKGGKHSSIKNFNESRLR